MKKFIALVFALIFALSACTVAFAAESTTTTTTTTTTTAAPQTYACDKCHKVLKTAALFNEHYYGGGCDVLFDDCKYCEERILAKNAEDHYGVCKKYSEDCTICGKNFDEKDKFEGHAAENCVCKECGVEVPVVEGKKTHKCADADKIINTVKDPATWETLFNKIVEFVKTIDFDALIAEVEGIIAEVEALLADIDFEGILADVKGMFA